jgi:general stress protein YciG
MENRTPEERKEFARMGGQIGGKRRARALTKERRQEIARKAAAARWGKK